MCCCTSSHRPDFIHPRFATNFCEAWKRVPRGKFPIPQRKLATTHISWMLALRERIFWVTRNDLLRAREWDGLGFTTALKTPDNTVVFTTPDEAKMIRKDQADCMGCLSHCGFSSWKDHDNNSTGRLADPRSFLYPEKPAGNCSWCTGPKSI